MNLNMRSNTSRRPMPVRDLRALRHARALGALEMSRQRAIQHLARQLPSALEPRPMLELFAALVRDVFPFDELRFMPVADGDGNVFHWGEEAAHHADYILRLHDLRLGEMILARAFPFGEDELNVFEDLLACLLYPLRNAMLYQDALVVARRDALTGLGNRKAFNEAMAHELARVDRYGGRLALMMLDMDGFKQVNDTHGHAVGDALLTHFASVLSQTLRTLDMAFRFGGDEFAILMPETGEDSADHLAQRLREAMRASPLRHGEARIPLASSMGSAQWRPGYDAKILLERADAELYEDKRLRHASRDAS